MNIWKLKQDFKEDDTKNCYNSNIVKIKTLLRLIVGGVKLQSSGKKPQVHLIIIREWAKNNQIISPPLTLSNC